LESERVRTLDAAISHVWKVAELASGQVLKSNFGRATEADRGLSRLPSTSPKRPTGIMVHASVEVGSDCFRSACWSLIADGTLPAAGSKANDVLPVHCPFWFREFLAMSNRLGKQAAPFDLSDIHGDSYRLEDFAGRWLLLVFHRHLG
jgi:hypothetical protein